MARSRTFRRMLILLVALLLLDACASSPTESPATAPATSSTTTLVLWYGWSGVARQSLVRLVDRFNQQHAGIRILAQSMPIASMSSDLRSATAAGSGPHMVLMPSGWVGSLAADGLLLPLDDLLSSTPALLPAALGSAQVRTTEGVTQQYGQPISFDTLALFYNRANVLTAPQTTEDMFTLAHGLSDPAATPPRWGLALNLSVESTIGYLYAFNGRLFDADGALALGNTGRAGAERWLAWVAAMSADQRVLARPYSSVEIDRETKNSQVLMTFGWAHQLGEYSQLWGDSLGVAPLPTLSETGAQPQPYLQSDLLAIHAGTSATEQQAAAAFLEFMVGEDAQRDLLGAGMQPTNSELALDGDTALMVAARAFRSQAEHAQPLPNGTNRSQIREELWQMQRSVLEGLATPADAVTAADGRLSVLLSP